MKKKFFTLAISLTSMIALACPTCEKAQPKIFRGITHGAGPDSNWDYLIIAFAALIVCYCTYITILRLIKPDEPDKLPIKNAFIN